MSGATENTELPATLSRAELATLFGVSVRTISTLIQRGIVTPTAKRSEYETMSSLHAYIEDLRATAAGRSNDAAVGAERLRIITVQRKRAERELAIAEGAFVAVEEVADTWSVAASQIKQKVMLIPRTARNRLPHFTAQDQADLLEIVRATLMEIADDLHGGDLAHVDATKLQAEPDQLQPKRRKSSRKSTAKVTG